MRKSAAVPIIVLCVLSTCAQCQSVQPLPTDAPSRQELLKLFDVLEVNQQVEAMGATMRNVMQQQYAQAAGSRLTLKQQEEMAKLQGELFDQLVASNLVQQFVDVIIPIYQQHFTASDVQGLVAFYSTPLGKKFLHEQPKIVAEYMPKIAAEVQTRVKQLRETNHFDERLKAILEQDKDR